ncbi:tRNA (guanosine(37)-N1)-methyltransferase TrmD [bacterium]|nr:tRNA (guanosine(37)-N1)-methyltransferase TrmD [bacterium]
MRIAIVSLFSGLFKAYSNESLFKKAAEKGIVDLEMIDIRDFTTDKHKTADDIPFGGGSGMVMKPEPVVEAVESLGEDYLRGKKVIVSPRGKLFEQENAEQFSNLEYLTIICGRYKGLDARVGEILDAEEVSIGNFVVGSGEIAALAVVDAVVRLLPGYLGDLESAETDSHSIPGRLLSAPEYTRPREFRGYRVPEILLSGNHAVIENWKRRKSLEITLRNHPGALGNVELPRDEQAFIESLKLGRFEGK